MRRCFTCFLIINKMFWYIVTEMLYIYHKDFVKHFNIFFASAPKKAIPPFLPEALLHWSAALIRNILRSLISRTDNHDRMFTWANVAQLLSCFPLNHCTILIMVF